MQKIKQLSISLCASLIIFSSSYSAADDTDLYFADLADGGSVTPNVLFILDTSGSMKELDGTNEKRIDRMKSAVQQLLASDVNMNIGLMQFNGEDAGGPILYPISNLEDNRAEMSAIVDDFINRGGTPTLDAMYEAALYMRGEGVDYGRTRGDPTRTRGSRRFFRVSHPDSYSGGTVIRPAGCNDSNLGTNACIDEVITGDAVYDSPVAGICQPNHIVVLSDGLVTSKNSVDKVKALTGVSSCAESGEDNLEECSVELASWLNNTDQSDLFEQDQFITVSTIAFNLQSGSSGQGYLQSIADAGGGTAYSAGTSEQLLAVFNEIASAVADVDASFTAPAASVNTFNRLSNSDQIYFSLFKPVVTSKWDGNVKRFRLGLDNNDEGEVAIRDRNGDLAIDDDTGAISDSADSFWPETDDTGAQVADADGPTVARGGVANQLSLDNRRVYTWIGSSSSTILNSIDLTLEDQKLSETNNALTEDVLGITEAMATAADPVAYRTELLQWARGVDVLDSDNDGSTTDIRRQMGDPMHSSPKVVNYQSALGSDDIDTVMYVGTNEGYLHAVDTSNGEEKFAFVPNELLPNLDTFYSNASGLSRPYGLDGPLTVWRDDADDDGIIETGDGDSAYVFVGMRRGGSSYYALDVTNPDVPKLAWTIKGGADGTTGFENMGQSWSRLSPVTMYINGASENVLVFGGGYDTNQDAREDGEAAEQTADASGNAIYIVKAETGELLWSGLGVRADGATYFEDMDYGFNSAIRAIDINRDDYVDQLYAADAGGQIWRFDLTQLHDGSNDLVDGGIIATISDSDDSDQRRFYNEPDVSLIEDDGKQYLAVSIGSGWRANPLDEVVNDRFYVIKQFSVYTAPEVYGRSAGRTADSAIHQSDLINVTPTATPATNEYGWYLELEGDGEKVLSTALTFDNKVIFSTYLPGTTVDVCEPDIGSARAYVMDVTSGAPVFDLDNSDGGSTDSLTVGDRGVDLAGEGPGADPSLLISEDALDDPILLFGTKQLDIDISHGTVRTFWADQGDSGDF